MTPTKTSTRVSATTPEKAIVRRAANVRGRSRLSQLRIRRRTVRFWSALGEGVTGTSNGQHEHRHRRVVLDLLAQVADVDVDRLLVLVQGLVVAQQLEQLPARVDPAGTAGQVAQDLELGGGQGDPALAALDPPALQVDEQVAVADHPAAGCVGQVAVGPPQEGL